MAHLHDDSAVTSSAAEHQKDHAEHPGFLQKIKDKLHIGNHKNHDEGVTSQATDSPVSSKSATGADDVSAPVVKKEEPAIAKPAEAAAPVSRNVEEVEQHHGVPTTDLNSLVGHESEHHGGVPTFLVALPDQDIPEEVTKETASDVSGQTGGHGGKEFDSEEVFSEAQQGEHHKGVPTFLVALPDQDIPDEVTKETSSDVSAGPTDQEQYHSQGKELDSEELFSDAQQGEHHGGVPTFLVALPDQEIPDEVNKGVSSDMGGKSGDSGVEQFDSDEVFSKAQEGEHHEGVPTFLVALPDQDIPDEVTKGVDATAASPDDKPAPSRAGVKESALEGSMFK